MVEVVATDEFADWYCDLYAFEPKRQAVLLIGGDKTGNPRFYDTMIPLAERIWKDYLDDPT